MYPVDDHGFTSLIFTTLPTSSTSIIFANVPIVLGISFLTFNAPVSLPTLISSSIKVSGFAVRAKLKYLVSHLPVLDEKSPK